jgi:type I site-specific restriction endonuclease
MAAFVERVQELMRYFPNLEKITENTISENLKEGKQLVHASEDVVHGIMTYIILQVRTASILASEMYLGKGRADLVLIDNSNKKAAIIELKYNKTAGEAIDQIKHREYFSSLEKKFGVFLIGVDIKPDRSVQIEYEIMGL